MAASGMRPVVAVYSSFLQRAFDQILHDVCIQKLPVVFAIDRAGIVGSDGETHQGIFDLSFLSEMPNMTVMAPKNKWELADMVRYAVEYNGPVAIRYPRGQAFEGLGEYRPAIEYGKSEWIYEEEDICLLAVGSMVKTALEVREKLIAEGRKVSLINARFVKPIDEEAVKKACKGHKLIVTMEENILSGGYGEAVRQYADSIKTKAKLLNIAIPDTFVEHGKPAELMQMLHMDAQGITEQIMKF
jgi:1-deoxy-D-xylulose-5-phosphate synthase